MKQNIGESGLAVFLGQLQKAVDSPEILNCSTKRRMFLTLLTVPCEISETRWYILLAHSQTAVSEIIII